MADKEFSEAGLKANILEAMAMEALGGHDLAEWEQSAKTGRKWQTECRKCGLTIYASDQAIYNLLEDTCPGVITV